MFTSPKPYRVQIIKSSATAAAWLWIRNDIRFSGNCLDTGIGAAVSPQARPQPALSTATPAPPETTTGAAAAYFNPHKIALPVLFPLSETVVFNGRSVRRVCARIYASQAFQRLLRAPKSKAYIPALRITYGCLSRHSIFH